MKTRSSPSGRVARAKVCASIALASCLTLCPQTVKSQDLEPRSYVNTPVGLNFAIANYRYVHGSVAFSPTIPLTDGKITTHSGTLAFVRAIDLFGMSSKIAVAFPYVSTSGSALLDGERRSRKVDGLGDPRLRVTTNFFGAPALTLEEFGGYRQDLLLGATFELSAPLGQYDSQRLLNIGTNRWSFKTELGASKAIGPLTLEGSAAATFFLPNDEFLGDLRLEQRPLFAAQTHAIYQFRPGLWASLNGSYYRGGRTITDGEPGDRLGNARLGFTLSVDVTQQASVKFYGSTGIYTRTGTDFDAVGIALQKRWGGGF